MKCTCADWESNIQFVDGPILFCLQRYGGTYQGKFFVYCPWCSKALADEKKEEATNDPKE